MKNTRFRPWGWIYIPVSVSGWLLTLLGLALTICVFVVADRNSHSVSDTLIGTFHWAVIFAILWNWVAAHTFSSS